MSAAATAVLQSDFTCPACAGHMAFAPDRQALVCVHCDGETVIPATAERAHDEICLLRADEHASFALGEGSVSHACRACAGEIVFSGREISLRCPYCDGPVVRQDGSSGFAPAGIAPFRVVQGMARAAIATWFRSRRLMPNALRNGAAQARVAGVYAPFWTFDSRVVVRYEGRRGRKSGKHTTWTKVSGTLEVPFDDILIPASGHITADIRDATGPWPVTRLVDFEPRYLAGFAAELHRVPAAEAARHACEDIRPILEQNVRAAIGGQRQRIDVLIPEMQEATCRSMLLPLWILHYEHGGRRYRVIASGVTGRAFGERPFCPVKVRVASFIATVAASVLGAAIGLLHAGI